MPKRATPSYPTSPLDDYHTAFSIGLRHDPIPYNVDLLRAIVEALLARIRKLSAVEERHARESIVALYADDCLDRLIPTELRFNQNLLAYAMPVLSLLCKDQFLRRHLDDIIGLLKTSDPKARLVLQDVPPVKERLFPLLQRLSTPQKQRTGGRHHSITVLRWQKNKLLELCKRHPFGRRRWTWIETHGPVIQSSLTTRVCRCHYRSVLTIPKHDVETCRTFIDLIHVILAHIHTASPLTIAKLLKPSSSVR